MPESDSETETGDSETVEGDGSSLKEQTVVCKSSDALEPNSSYERENRQQTPVLSKPIQQSVAISEVVPSAKEIKPKVMRVPSPPQVQRVIKDQVESSLVQQTQVPVSQIVQVPLQQTLERGTGQQQFLQIVGGDGKTQLLQIVGNSSDQQVFELVTSIGQQPILRHVSNQTQQVVQERTRVPPAEEQIIHYISDTPEGHTVISQDQSQEEIILTSGGHHEQVVQEDQVVINEGSQEQVIYSDVSQHRVVLNDPQNEQIILTEAAQEQVVRSGFIQEQVIEEIVMEGDPSHAPHLEIVVSSSHRPTVQSPLWKQPEISSKPAHVSVLRHQPHQQILGRIPMMIVSEASAPHSSLRPQTIYTVPSSSQTSVVTASQQAPSSALMVTSVAREGQIIQTDNIIETAFAAATRGESEPEMVQSDGNLRVAVQVARQPEDIVQQQPRNQVVGPGHSAEMMNIEDIDVQPLQASQEDIMRTMESIANELLGVSSIDLAP